MVYDCFTFFNEIDLLDLRLNELNSVVDYFIIVESNLTFTGKKKPFVFEKNRDKFKRFLPKIIYLKITDLQHPPNIASEPIYQTNKTIQKNAIFWNREFYQRNCIVRGLKNAKDSDIILIGDIDEIPKTHLIKTIHPTKKPQIFQMQAYYYFLNCQSDKYDDCTRAITYAQLKKTTPQQVRSLTTSDCLVHPNAGWHFSYIGDIKTITTKINSFSHQELNSEKYASADNIEFSIHNNLDLFHRGIKYKTVPINHTFPKYLQAHQKKFSHLINTKKPSDLASQQAIQNSRFHEIEQQQIIDRLQQKISEQTELINYQTQELNNIKNSKFYQLWRQFVAIKEKFL